MLINSYLKDGYIKSTLEQAKKAQRGDQRYSSNLSLTSALGKVCVVNAMSQPVYPREFLDTHFIGGWVGLGAWSGRV